MRSIDLKFEELSNRLVKLKRRKEYWQTRCDKHHSRTLNALSETRRELLDIIERRQRMS